MLRNCLAIVAVVACLALTGDATNPPKPYDPPMPVPAAAVSVAPYGLDFGVVPPHTALEGRFTLVNRSSEPRRVLHTVPSCQCTTVEIEGKEIPAGGSLEVPVRMKVSSTGRKSANVKVLVERQEQPITFEMRAEAAYPVRAAVRDSRGMPQPYIDAAEDPSRLKGVVEVRSDDGRPFRVRSVQGMPPRHADGNTPPDAALPRHDLEFDLPREPCDQVPRYLIVETDRPDARLIDVRVRHPCTRILPGIDIAEFRSNAGVVPAAGSATFEIEVKKMVSNRLSSVESLDPRFKAELAEQRSDGSSVVGVIRLTPREDVRGFFLIPVRLSAVDAEGRPYQVQRPEPAAPGEMPRMVTLPSSADLLVYGVVE